MKINRNVKKSKLKQVSCKNESNMLEKRIEEICKYPDKFINEYHIYDDVNFPIGSKNYVEYVRLHDGLIYKIVNGANAGQIDPILQITGEGDKLLNPVCKNVNKILYDPIIGENPQSDPIWWVRKFKNNKDVLSAIFKTL